MLYLNPPLFTIYGISFFPDHENAQQWYYLPLQPVVARGSDGSPRFVLRKFPQSGTNAGGGILEFDVNLAIDPATLRSATAKLQAQIQLPGDDAALILTPAPVIDGTVKLMMLGQLSGSGDTQSAHVTGAYPAKPSLYGDNQASFSVLLDAWATQLIEASLQPEGMTPVAIIYSLVYRALHPSYNVKARVHWDEVYTSLKSSFSEDGIFTSSNISDEVDKLVRSQAVELDIDDMSDSSDPNSTPAGKSMLGQIKTMIFDTFFTPAPDPPTDKPGGWDQFGNAMKGLITTGTQAWLTGGLSTLAHFSWSKSSLTNSKKLSLDIDLHERTAVDMNMYPQGHLADLIPADAKSSGKLVQAIQINSAFFAQRNLSVEANCDFKKEGISSILAFLNYRDEVNQVDNKATLHLSADDGNLGKESWNSVLTGSGAQQKMVFDVLVSYQINFANADPSSGVPTSLMSPITTTSWDDWTINPRDLYQVKNIQFLVEPQFPWLSSDGKSGSYGALTLTVCYPNKDNPKIKKSLLITPTTSTALADGSGNNFCGVYWPLFQSDPTLSSFDYQITYVSPSGPPQTSQWFTTDSSVVLLYDSPGPQRRLFIMVPNPWPTSLNSLVLTVPSGSDKVYMFQAGSPSKLVTVQLSSPDDKFVAYDAIFITNDGNQTQLPTSLTDSPVLSLSATMKAHDMVAVQPQAAPFGGALQQIKVWLAAGEQSPALPDTNTAPTLTFTSSGDAGHFQYDFTANRGVKYLAWYYYRNGFAPYKQEAWSDVVGTNPVLIPVLASNPMGG